MESLDELRLVGLSHRTASVEVRERCSVPQDELPARLAALLAEPQIEEALLLSTCNRSEVLVAAPSGTDPTDAVRNTQFSGLPEEQLYVYAGVQAIIHLFRVVSGLDSLVLGETEILAQTRRAFEVAQDVGASGPVLAPLMTQAFSIGKRVRNETELGSGTLSVAKVAVDVAHRAFGGFEDNDALVVGTGETGLLVARHLRDGRIGKLHFANRTLARAEEAAAEFDGHAHSLDDLLSVVPKVDVIVVCVDGGEMLIRPEHFPRRRLKRRDMPRLVLDLSVPRAVDPRVGKLKEVLLYTVDDLEPVVHDNKRARADATGASAEILVAGVHKFLALRTYAAFSPAITDLRQRFEEIREGAVDRITEGKATARELELAHDLSRRLLDLSLEKMKDGARRSRSEAALDREYQRFLENL